MTGDAIVGQHSSGLQQIRRRSLLAYLRGRLRDQSAIASMPEVLVTTVIMLVILAASLALYEVAAGSQERANNRASGLMQQQLAIERMTRELRQATSITPVSSRVIDSVTWVAPDGGGARVQRRVRYECVQGTCSRWEGPPDGALTGGPVTVVRDVRNANIFNLQPDLINPEYLAVSMQVDIKGYDNPITLSGGVTLRNIARDS